eukprot:TRINITY_DN514_c0_g1_i1.p1 TRINITY_DN514_c0_g1~~TRINITY_DN514_c0_g1_i1.p1  ORF type:complete len:367 (+),score=107.77 TRINITY_DN514_c0_g1_i1:34-1134(+)
METTQWTQAVMEQLRGLPTQDKQIELLLLVNSQLVAEIRRLQCLLDTTNAVMNSEFHLGKGDHAPTAAAAVDPATTTTTTTTVTGTATPGARTPATTTPKTKKVAAPPPSPRASSKQPSNGTPKKNQKQEEEKAGDGEIEDEEAPASSTTTTTTTTTATNKSPKQVAKKRKVENASTGVTSAQASPAKKNQTASATTPTSAASASASASTNGGEAGAEESKSARKKRKRLEREQAEKVPPPLDPKTLPPGPLPEKSKFPTRNAAGGVTYIDIKPGVGGIISPGKMVTMKYKGYLRDGTMFDSGDSFQFRWGLGQVIKGWDKGLKGMKQGGKRKLVIPPNMGYGKQRAGKIPPNSTLCFDVELVKIH